MSLPRNSISAVCYGFVDDVTWGSPLKTFVYRRLPATHPLNSTGKEVELRYRFIDAGAESEAKSSQYRVLTGLKGSWSQYDWESAIGLMGSKTKDRQTGNFSDSGFKQVIGDYSAKIPDPDFFNHDYNIGQHNSPAVINTLFPQF